jgi:hypothetical protein
MVDEHVDDAKIMFQSRCARSNEALLGGSFVNCERLQYMLLMHLLL